MASLMMDCNSLLVYSKIGNGVGLTVDGVNWPHGILNELYIHAEDTDNSLKKATIFISIIYQKHYYYYFQTLQGQKDYFQLEMGIWEAKCA